MSLILSKKIYDIKEIPNETGIYYFIDSLNIPIYIGKSLDLNKRISQHLNSKSKKSEKIKIRNKKKFSNTQQKIKKKKEGCTRIEIHKR